MKFRKWLELSESSEHINESPQLIIDLGYSKVANEIKKLMTYYNYDPEYLEDLGNNIYEYSASEKGQLSNIRFMFFIINDEILGGTVLKRSTIKNTHGSAESFEALYTANFTKIKVKGLLYKLYSTFSKKYNVYVVSGQQQTSDSKKVWSRWLREKENIKEIFGYHYKEKKLIDYKQISNFWDTSDKMSERRIVVKFK